jgi:hypothetical protein
MAGGETESYGSLSEYWSRGKWSIEKTDDPPKTNPGFLYGMACTSPTVCIGVGSSADDLDEATSPLAERWDGTRWSRMGIVVPPGPPPWTYKALLGVSCVSSTACVAVGTVDTADGYQSNLIELLTGEDWVIQTAPSPVGAMSASLAGVSCSGTFCSAVGTYTTQLALSAQALTSTVVSTPVVSTPAGIRITGLRATPLGHGCATETGTSERELKAVIADATCRHFRLTVNGIIEVGGKVLHPGRGTVIASIRVKLPGGPLNAAARTMAAGGRWRFSLVLPGVNRDPVPPSYLIVVQYGGGNSGAPVGTERRIRIESEPRGL